MPGNTILWRSANGKWTIERLQGGEIIVADANTGWNDNPLLYSNGQVSYESPGRIPKYVKRLVRFYLTENQQ